MGNKSMYKKRGKREQRARQRRHMQAVRAMQNAMKINKAPQDAVVGNTDIQHVTIRNENNMECTNIEEKIDVLKQEQIEETVESGDDDACRNDTLRQTPVDEEVWVVRKQLCRGCHSDGAFWSLQTTTEGDTYGDLLQTYFNIQLCPVSADSPALSAICTLCAARLREARAFSAQARAAEERFARLYKQNRVRALVNEVVIEKDPPKIKNEVDDFEIIYHVFDNVDDVEQDTANSNFDNLEPSIDELAPTINNNKKTQELCNKPTSKNLFHLSPSNAFIVERIGNLFKCTRTDCCGKLYNRSGIRRHVMNVHAKSRNPKSSIDELAPKIKKNKKTQKRCNKPATKKYDPESSTQERCNKPVSKTLFRLSPSDYERDGNLFKCTRSQCGRKLYNRRGIQIHVKNVHLKSPFQLSRSDYERVGHFMKCVRCDKQFNSVRGLSHHIKYIHMNIPKYNCTLCAKTFRTLAPFMKHKLDEHSLDDRIKCNACDSTFNTRGQLARHKNSFHLLGEKHFCPDCDYESFCAAAITKHKFKHKSVKDYQCKFCRKAFLRKSTMVMHEKIHTGDRKKICNECGQAFVQKASLNYHMTKYHPEVKF